MNKNLVTLWNVVCWCTRAVFRVVVVFTYFVLEMMVASANSRSGSKGFAEKHQEDVERFGRDQWRASHFEATGEIPPWHEYRADGSMRSD